MLKKLLLVSVCVVMLANFTGFIAMAEVEIDRSETVTLKYLYPLGGGFNVVDSMAENSTIKRANEARNVVIEFIHPPAGQEAEQFNLMLVSDDLPDLVTHGWGIPQLFPGGAALGH